MIFKTIISLLIILITSSKIWAKSYVGHLGLGVSTQLANEIPSISIKNYNSDSFAWGLLGNFSTKDKKGGWGIGGKAYKNIFAEPHLYFFAGFLFGIVNSKLDNDSGSKTGVQIDFTVGSEFFIPGLESIGMSFEAGLSLNTIDEFVVETAGHSFITAAIHFYL